MSSPAGLPLAGMLEDCFGYRGDAAGERDLSEKVVVGDSGPFCGFDDELQPKKEVNFAAAGDLGFVGCAESGVMS